MNEIVEKLKDGEPLLDSILMHMASVYSALGKFEESVLMYRRVTNNLERIYGEALLKLKLSAFIYYWLEYRMLSLYFW